VESQNLGACARSLISREGKSRNGKLIPVKEEREDFKKETSHKKEAREMREQITFSGWMRHSGKEEGMGGNPTGKSVRRKDLRLGADEGVGLIAGRKRRRSCTDGKDKKSRFDGRRSSTKVCHQGSSGRLRGERGPF